MSLHRKTRSYLFHEFIKRNYRGSKKKVQRDLLRIHPDEILKLSAERELLFSVLKDIYTLFTPSPESEKTDIK